MGVCVPQSRWRPRQAQWPPRRPQAGAGVALRRRAPGWAAAISASAGRGDEPRLPGNPGLVMPVSFESRVTPESDWHDSWSLSAAAAAQCRGLGLL